MKNQRQPKYRAWYKADIEKNEPLKFEWDLVEGSYARFVNGKLGTDFAYTIESVFCDDDWIKEQYTGLTDKNGLEIYEGDIVRHRRYWNGAVDQYGDPISDSGFYTRLGHVTITTSKGIAINGNQYFESDCGLSDSSRKYNENPGCWSDCAQVIGNIHENPELLKAKKCEEFGE